MTLLFWLGIGLPLVVIVILIVVIVVVYMKKRWATQVPAVDNDSESQSRYTRFKAWRAHYYTKNMYSWISISRNWVILIWHNIHLFVFPEQNKFLELYFTMRDLN